MSNVAKLEFISQNLLVNLVLAMTSVLACPTAKACDDNKSISDQNFLGVKELSLGQAVEFSNGPEGFLCRPINWQGKTLAWVHAPFRNSKQTLVTRCQRNESQSFNAVTGVMIESYDGIDDHESIVEWDHTSKKLTFKHVTLPMRHLFSNPAYCGSLVAYWGIERYEKSHRVYAMIYDLEHKKIQSKEDVGTITAFQTDASGYLPAAMWSSKGDKVEFPAVSKRPMADIRGVSIRP